MMAIDVIATREPIRPLWCLQELRRSLGSGPRLFSAVAAIAILLLLLAVSMMTPQPRIAIAVRVLAISPAGLGLAVGMSDGTIYECASQDLTDCRSLDAKGRLNDLRYSDFGELAIADQNIRLIELHGSPAKLIRSDGANYGTVRFESGRRRILTINGKGKVLNVDLESGNTSTVFCCSTIWGEVDFIDGGDKAVWAGHWPGIWHVSEDKLLGRLTAQREEMTFGPIAMDLEERLLYMGSQDGRLYQWSIDSRELLAKSTLLSGYVMTVSILGTSGWVAYASQPGIVRLWNPKANVHRIVEPARGASNIVFDQRRGLAVFGTESGAIEFWDLPNERLVETKRLLQTR